MWSSVALLLQAYSTRRFTGWFFEWRYGGAIYLIILGLVALLWIRPKLQDWFGWPKDPEEQGPIRLGLSERKPSSRRSETTKIEADKHVH